MCRGIVVEKNRLDYWGGGVERSTLVRLYLVAAVVKILRGGSRWRIGWIGAHSIARVPLL